MNKFLASALLVCITLQAPLGSANEVKSFVFNGQKTQQVNLKSEKFHTEYTYETIETTCYETIETGTTESCSYETECDGAQWQRPLPPGEPPPPSSNPPSEPPYRPEPSWPPPSSNPPSEPPYRPEPPSRPSCREVRRCHTVPTYEQRPYSCQKTISTPHVIKDYDVLANVFFNFGEVPTGVQANEQFNVTIKGDEITTQVKDTGKLVMFADRESTQTITGTTLSLAVNHKVQFVTKESLVAPFKANPKSITLQQGVLSFTVGPIEHPNTFIPAVKLVQKNTLLNRSLKQSEYRLIDGNGATIVQVDLKALGVVLDPKTRVEVSAVAKLFVSGGILNPKILPAKLEKTGKAKLKVE